MTDTLPSWATEQAREVALRWFHPSMVGHVRLRDAVATALLSAYQQGKQDGQRETREQDAKVAEAAGDTWSNSRDPMTCCQEAAVDAKCEEIAAAIRSLDEVEK